MRRLLFGTPFRRTEHRREAEIRPEGARPGRPRGRSRARDGPSASPSDSREGRSRASCPSRHLRIHARRAGHPRGCGDRGGLSFGYFPLAEQRKVTRLRVREPDSNNPRDSAIQRSPKSETPTTVQTATGRWSAQTCVTTLERGNDQRHPRRDREAKRQALNQRGPGAHHARPSTFPIHTFKTNQSPTPDDSPRNRADRG